MRALWLAALVVFAAGACTKPNPAYLIWIDGGREGAGDGAGDGATGAADGGDAVAGDAGADAAADVSTGCRGNGDCAGDPRGPVCLPGGACAACAVSDHCRTDGGALVCDQTTHQCVQCVQHGDCSGTAPICEAQRCVACKADAECVAKLGSPDPGVCMDDGHCAGASEVVYAKGGASCPGTGTAAAPFCQSQDAMNAISQDRRIVVLRGVVGDWTLGFSAAPVTVIGQGGASIRAAGSNDGITLNGADALIRGLTVSSGAGAGIVARSGSTLRLRGCLIEGNTGGPGIQTTNAAFEIENTVIARNGGSNFAGVNLGPTGAAPQIFRNNTVVGNGLIGVACGASYTVAGSIVHGNGGLQYSPGCVANDPCAASCSPLDPVLDEAAGRYQLTASSPSACRDVLDAAPRTDRKGLARPQGTKSDCGADEFQVP